MCKCVFKRLISQKRDESQPKSDVVHEEMSFIVAKWSRSESDETLISKADEALYEAKHTVRNRVVVATEQ